MNADDSIQEKGAGELKTGTLVRTTRVTEEGVHELVGEVGEQVGGREEGCGRDNVSLVTTSILPPIDSDGESAAQGHSRATRIQFVIVCAVLLVDSISTTMLFSYVGLLIAHVEPTFNRSTAGYVSGVLIGLFQGAQVFSLPFWGGLSDKVGRKPVLLTSLMLSAAVAVSFGLAGHLWMMFIIRFVHGSIVAGAITVKSYITEITDETNAAKAFSMMSLARSFGSFIGPTIGGLLYDPIRNNGFLAGVFGEDNQLLLDYPALIPGIVLATYALGVSVLVNRYMVETNANAVPIRDYCSERCIAFLTRLQGIFHTAAGPRFAQVPSGSESVDEMQGVQEEGVTGTSKEMGPQMDELPITATVPGVPGEAVPGEDPELPVGELLRANRELNARVSLGYYDVWTHPVLKYIIPMYMALTSYNIGTMEVIPLYGIAYMKDGGLELTSAQVGGLLMSGAVAAIIANSLFAVVAKNIALMRLWMLCNCVGAIATFALATTSVAAGHYWAVLGMVACINLVRTTSTTWCFSMYNMFVANVAPKKHLGRVTAMCQATGAMARCFSPMLTSAIFAWSISSPDHIFPFNHYCVFCFTASLALLCMVLSRRIDPELVAKRHK